MAYSSLTWRRTTRIAIPLLLALVLAACGGAPPVAQSPTSAAPSATTVTAAPSATAAPSVAPATAAPSPTDIPPTETPAPKPPTPTAAAPTAAPAKVALPAPVYLLSAKGATNQIVRLDRDGSMVAPITFEPQSVLDFDVAADAGAITYVTGDETKRTLVILDGGGRRELFVGEVSAPRISPDGRSLVARIDGTALTPVGVWSFPISGGKPSLVQADDSLTGQKPPDGTAWTYTPISYDPSGQRLLLWAYNQAGPSIPGGELVVLDRGGAAPVRAAACCEGADWSVDGSAVTIVGGGPGPDVRYGLYRIDAASGGEKPLISQDDHAYRLATGARQLRDGQVYAFYQEVATDVFNWDYPFTPQMVRVAADGKITPLRHDSYPAGEVLWREDASGALITTRDHLLWLDSSGGPAVETSALGSMLYWADTVRPLYEGDCTQLPQIGWQPPASRKFSAGARDLQARLNASGQQAGTPDGFFGDQTRDALHQFQASQRLPPSDALDCATWQALLGRT